MRTITALLLLPLILTGTAATGTALAQERREIPEFAALGDTTPDRLAEMEAFMEEYRSAWSEQDTTRVAALHTADTEWINAYARMFRGRDALETFVGERLFPGFSPEVSREEAELMRMISVRFIGPDAAVIHMYTDSHRGVSRNEGEAARRTHFHLVLGRTEDGWKIGHTAIMDAR